MPEPRNLQQQCVAFDLKQKLIKEHLSRNICYPRIRPLQFPDIGHLRAFQLRSGRQRELRNLIKCFFPRCASASNLSTFKAEMLCLSTTVDTEVRLATHVFCFCRRFVFN